MRSSESAFQCECEGNKADKIGTIEQSKSGATKHDIHAYKNKMFA